MNRNENNFRVNEIEDGGLPGKENGVVVKDYR
jgi:hypothetical protein